VSHKNFIGPNLRGKSTQIVDNKLVFAAKFIRHKWNGDAHRAIADAMAYRDVWLFLDKREKAKVTQNGL